MFYVRMIVHMGYPHELYSTVGIAQSSLGGMAYNTNKGMQGAFGNAFERF